MAQRPLFFLLDGNALLHRAWHAIPPLTTKDGLVVNAVYGFMSVLEKMRAQYAPAYMAVAWDLPGETFRHQEFAAYKAQRERKADELYAQIPLIQELLAAYGIPSLTAKGFEADDILATLAARNDAAGDVDTAIVTGDLDALQLVSPTTRVIAFVKGLSEVREYDPAAVEERFGIPPERLADYKALAGDASDNFPGVPGIGAKTATELLQQHGSLAGILAARDAKELPERIAKKFLKMDDHIAQMSRLALAVRDVPVKMTREEAAVRPPDLALLLPLLRAWEFRRWLQVYDEGATSTDRPARRGTRRHDVVQHAHVADVVDDRMGVIILSKPSDLFGEKSVEIAVCSSRGVFLDRNATTATLQSVADALAGAAVIVGHDLKATFHAAARVGVELADALRSKELLDTMVTSYLLHPGDREATFVEVANSALDLALPQDVDLATTARHLLPLADVLATRLGEARCAALYRDIEAPLIPVLYSMERAGIAVDVARLRALSKEFTAASAALSAKIIHFAGEEFNVNSPSQLAQVLFERLKLPTKGIKKTKSGYSTAAPELEKLLDAHPIVPLIGDYRELTKLTSTYADTLPALVGNDGRVHTTFNQTIAATGRLSSSNPNLQNIPVRSELGRKIRSAFVAPAGRLLLSADYSQIELRLAAAMAKDAALLAAFRDGADIHRRTAAEIWDVAEEKVTKDQRAAAKAINFSILYGVGPRSLARAAGLSFEEAREFIARYFAVHPGIAAYMDAMKLQARDQGFVETLFGRRRYLPEITAGIPQLVAAAERMAVNMPIQGTQADIVKKAMLAVDAWIRAEDVPAVLVLQVHDELVLDVAADAVQMVGEKVRALMAGVVTLDVPLVVDVATGASWADLE